MGRYLLQYGGHEMGSDKLSKIDKQIAALNNKKRQIVTQEKNKERKDDTRRKILLGSWLLADMKKSQGRHDQIVREMGDYLTRDSDRQLFGLQPLPSNSSKG